MIRATDKQTGETKEQCRLKSGLTRRRWGEEKGDMKRRVQFDVKVGKRVEREIEEEEE